MASSKPSPDRFQREIDDIIRLAERRLERQSPRYRARKTVHRFSRSLEGLNIRLPAAQTLAGWGLAMLLVSWLAGLLIRGSPVAFLLQVVGIALLAAGIILSLTRDKGTGGSGAKTWRGERISYGSPYGDDLLQRLRRFFRRR